ncbi:SDR family oxidoreductase [Balneola sp. MJW-20]|uniref:SDR family oxidoreductase n=1 Tax=Gracilimonas aurantiaca TaxID=3234185 RepID=UPI0034663096
MTILVTGSSRGIGFAIAEKLLEEGISVIGTSRSKHSPFKNAQYSHIKCDLSNDDELDLIRDLISNKCPDVVINNAGIFEDADISSDDSSWLNNWDKTLQVNLKAPAIICKWAVNTWVKKECPGRIINVSSRAAYRGDTQEYASYAASKAGLVAFTKSLARDLGKNKITAYTIAPGFVHTDMAENSIQIYGKDYLTKGLALDNIAPPSQVGELAYFLSTADITHMTGQTFHINSGSYII